MSAPSRTPTRLFLTNASSERFHVMNLLRRTSLRRPTSERQNIGLISLVSALLTTKKNTNHAKNCGQIQMPQKFHGFVFSFLHTPTFPPPHLHQIIQTFCHTICHVNSQWSYLWRCSAAGLLILLSGLFSGLTLGLCGMDINQLKVRGRLTFFGDFVAPNYTKEELTWLGVLLRMVIK